MMFFLNVFFLPPSISTCTPTVVAATLEYFIWYHKIKESIKTFGRVFVLYQKKHPFDESFEKSDNSQRGFSEGKRRFVVGWFVFWQSCEITTKG